MFLMLIFIELGFRQKCTEKIKRRAAQCQICRVEAKEEDIRNIAKTNNKVKSIEKKKAIEKIKNEKVIKKG